MDYSDQLEEEQRLRLQEMNIKHVGRPSPLKDVIRELMPDPFATLDPNLRYRIKATFLERTGRDTTDNSIVVAVSALRKSARGNGAATEEGTGLRKKRGRKPGKRGRKAGRRKAEELETKPTGKCNCACPACLLHDMATDYEQLKAKHAQIMEALKC